MVQNWEIKGNFIAKNGWLLSIAGCQIKDNFILFRFWIYLWVHKPIHEQFNDSRSINRDCNLNWRFIRPFSDFSKPGLNRWVSGSSMKMLWQTTESSKKPMFRTCNVRDACYLSYFSRHIQKYLILWNKFSANYGLKPSFTHNLSNSFFLHLLSSWIKLAPIWFCSSQVPWLQSTYI